MALSSWDKDLIATCCTEKGWRSERIIKAFPGKNWDISSVDSVIKNETECTRYTEREVTDLKYFSFQPVLHDWCNKGRGMCYSVCGMVHIKEPLLLIGKSSLCGGSGLPFLLSEWSLTICLTRYNRK